MPQIFQTNFGDRDLIIETGKLAQQADSAVMVRYGDTVVLVTACISNEVKENSDFVRLTVDYEERHYAVGKIPGSFLRREGRPGEQATLAARLCDRSIRPLFLKSLPNDIQVVVTVLSTDQENDPDVLAVIGASAALTISRIPFSGPIGASRIGYIDGKMVLNPLLPQMNDSLLDLVVASSRENIVMVESGSREIDPEIYLEAVKFAHQENQKLIKLQDELREAIGKSKLSVEGLGFNNDLLNTISTDFGQKMVAALDSANRTERQASLDETKAEIKAKLKETYSEAEIGGAIEEVLKKICRAKILQTQKHVDGRDVNQIRPLSAEVGLLPRTHGSGLFSRGQTQVLTITTLGSLGQGQTVDDLGLEDTKRFMHHYNFPPFSTGEVKRMGSPGRREIGHGALAHKALVPIIPDEQEFSYTIRLVSEVLSSNGSTSMGSVCASTLSLMDAGVPIKAPVVGIAMGLVTDKDDPEKYVVLTDIEGMEDFYGDMDYKVAGTANGITAIQLDIKLQGVRYDILSKATLQAREAHWVLLEKLKEAISEVRPNLSKYAPRMYRITIDPSKIGALIGPGGKNIKAIIEETKTTIEVSNDGTVVIGSPSEESAQAAIRRVEGLTQEVEVGAIYTGKVTRIQNFGAFVEVLPGKEGLVHISELADHHVAKVEDVVKIGDEIMVKVTEIDRLGRINLSRKAVFGDQSKSADTHPESIERPHFHKQQRPSHTSRPGMPSHERREERRQPFKSK
ncbi:MAG: polyribonucleotide nucleotidyltransferase [Dehalococcoidia bacterium]|nr:polyribonucleotide nucleotidyltransferase [Dehalococcoidia bacterium]MDD5494216.1 polyribonucleotide nucleotidyltransferase [Dehalococcoidia bacterium]